MLRACLPTAPESARRQAMRRRWMERRTIITSGVRIRARFPARLCALACVSLGRCGQLAPAAVRRRL